MGSMDFGHNCGCFLCCYCFQVATVDKFQGQQNDFILLSLVRTRFVGHLRDVRRLVVAMSRARLGMYVFCRRSLFEQCYELQPTFQLLLQRPDQLGLNLDEITPFTERLVGDTGRIHFVSGVEEMASVVNFKMHQLYQARITSQHFNQYPAHSGQVAPSLGALEGQDSQRHSTSWHHGGDVDLPLLADGAHGDVPLESSSKEETQMEGLANGQNEDVPLESSSKEEAQMEGLANGQNEDVPLESSSKEEAQMEGLANGQNGDVPLESSSKGETQTDGLEKDEGGVMVSEISSKDETRMGE
ncbi:hypothetical protein HHK36_009461 [Tetracentron sinense]|uniref:DNA2/NAM7 helicase-like C-terminal domain-containing protein n=1 Tax=Tetracentron sinense TaxID=13715 RepID=A0A834ZAX9_TETSI|nr:hypothetical protein HHK36_009461 [Tetracentron sinense]